MNAVDLRLYGIVGPENVGGRDLVALVRAAVKGGATLIQYRDKSGETRAMTDRVRALKVALAGSGVPLLVNDRVDVALAAGADGVHIGQDDMAAADARRLLGPHAIIGLTVQNLAEAEAARGEPLDYVCIGGVFATASKDNAHPPIGLDGFAAVAAAARQAVPGLPVGAIAGIDAGNAGKVVAAGADGVAVISALFSASDLEEAARRLRGLVDEALAARRRAA